MEKCWFLIITAGLLATACGNGDGAGAGGGVGISPISTTPVAISAPAATPSPTPSPTPGPDTYVYQFTGQGVTFSADIFYYTLANYAGSGAESALVMYTIPDANPVTITVTARSVIGDFTLNTGAGTLNTILYKNGIAISSHSITTNATGAALSDTD